tara:strand:+ start:598 stop:1251 length:654 start_codon:yes stop_codon:yes gene_type:complete
MNIQIKTLTSNVNIKLNHKVINFYVITLDKYYPLNGINIGIDKVYTTIQNELYNSLYYPIKNELFNNDYLQDNHLNDFNEIFETLILNGHYFDYNFTVDSLFSVLTNQLNKLFIRIKKNRIKKIVLNEVVKNNDDFILDYRNIEKHSINTLVNTIKDCCYTQLLTFVFYYDNTCINYNLNTLNEIVLDLKKLANTNEYTKYIKETVQFELKQIQLNN